MRGGRRGGRGQEADGTGVSPWDQHHHGAGGGLQGTTGVKDVAQTLLVEVTQEMHRSRLHPSNHRTILAKQLSIRGGKETREMQLPLNAIHVTDYLHATTDEDTGNVINNANIQCGQVRSLGKSKGSHRRIHDEKWLRSE